MRDLGSVLVGETVKLSNQWVTVKKVVRERRGEVAWVQGLTVDGRLVIYRGVYSDKVKVRGEK